jgi:4'-phosphopantetheinyl transferase
MPLLKTIMLNDFTQVFVWKITESFEELFQSVALKEISLTRLNSMKSQSHQNGFLSVRKLLIEAGYTDFDMYYDAYGKPHLEDGKHISISHSHGFSVIVISNVNIGVDLEIIKDKTLKLAPRYMDVSHLENLSEAHQLIKATVVWGIKESVFKIKNEIGISFKNDIFESEFNLSDKKCTVELRYNTIERFNILFDLIENYVFVCAFSSTPISLATDEKKQ